MIDAKVNLKSLNETELCDFAKKNGLEEYRVKQLIHWIYRKYAETIYDITEFSKELRIKLDKLAYISNVEVIKRIKSKDDTEKFLLKLEDNNLIECVLIPVDYRSTLCISSQVGCRMKCDFCQTGKSGFIRDLLAYEIVDQVIAINKLIKPKKVTNIVFMGMGEPLLNLKEVIEAVKRIKNYIGISKKKITISTCGIAPSITEMSRELPDVNLAVSLNATNDEIRNKLMPINRKYPIKVLLNACKEYSKRTHKTITFEYVLISGINDSINDALNLYNLIKDLKCKVNLIPFNEQPDILYRKPDLERIINFQNILNKKGLRTFLRVSRGQDIQAACGQLRMYCS